LLRRACGGDLRRELRHVGLRLFEVEAIAGASGGELRVLIDALGGQRERGLERARQFSWDRMAKETLAVCDEAERQSEARKAR
jgi:hypothetical protein